MSNSSGRLKNIKRASILPKVELVGLENHLKPDQMPILDASPVGRHRLVQALKNRYGIMFRNVPGVANILKEYDSQVKNIKDLYDSLGE